MPNFDFVKPSPTGLNDKKTKSSTSDESETFFGRSRKRRFPQEIFEPVTSRRILWILLLLQV